MSVHVKVAGAWQEISADAAAGGVPWARVSGGTVTEVTNADGSVDEVHTFTASGQLTVETPGFARVLVVGGGGAEGFNGGGYSGGGGGQVYDGYVELSSGTLALVVGAERPATPNTANGVEGNFSQFGSIKMFGGGGGTSGGTVGPTGGGGNQVGNGAGGPAAGGVPGPGVVSDITGTAVEYGKGGAVAVHNNGGKGEGGGDRGVIVVRVQKSTPTVSGVAATGGTVTEYTADGSNGVAGQKYRVHEFVADGTFTVTQEGTVDLLVVSGGVGGSGPGDTNNGGHGGGVTRLFGYTVTPGTFPVKVGGSNAMSAFGSIVAAAAQPGQETSAGSQGYYGGGGGGGAGGNGAGGGSHQGGAGGPGVESSLSGTVRKYGGGGGGSGYDNAGGAGTDGGGNGAKKDAGGSPGLANTGGGGGAGSVNQPGQPGGSGVVIVRYEIA